MINNNYKRQALQHLPHVCVICGETEKKLLTADHIVPRSMGGSLKTSNLRVLCYDCHRVATNQYRRARLTQVSEDGSIKQINTWRTRKKLKPPRSKAKYANRINGW